MQNRKDITRGRINGAAAARGTNSELLPLARPPPPRGRPESGLAHRRPPSTPIRGVPSGHLGGELTPILAHWLHHDGYGDGQPLVVHLRREEEVISADDGHAESGRSAEEGAQRVAAARLRAGGMAGGGGTPACPRRSHPHTQAVEARTAGREFWRVSQGRAWRVTNERNLPPRCVPEEVWLRRRRRRLGWRLGRAREQVDDNPARLP